KRVLAAFAAVGAACVALMGYVLYDVFLKPPTIVGTWAGSRIEFETGGPIIHNQFRLVLDEKKRASMTLQEKFTSVGTYTVRGDLLKLTFTAEKDEDGGGGGENDEDGGEAATSERQYKISLGRSTLDLFDPSSGKKVV